MLLLPYYYPVSQKSNSALSLISIQPLVRASLPNSGYGILGIDDIEEKEIEVKVTEIKNEKQNEDVIGTKNDHENLVTPFIIEKETRRKKETDERSIVSSRRQIKRKKLQSYVKKPFD